MPKVGWFGSRSRFIYSNKATANMGLRRFVCFREWGDGKLGWLRWICFRVEHGESGWLRWTCAVPEQWQGGAGTAGKAFKCYQRSEMIGINWSTDDENCSGIGLGSGLDQSGESGGSSKRAWPNWGCRASKRRWRAWKRWRTPQIGVRRWPVQLCWSFQVSSW